MGYLDRFGGVKEIRVAAWLDEVTHEEWVPQHRIRYFKRVVGPGGGEEEGEEDVVWHRFERVDRVFGSAGLPGCGGGK